jgi:hypothetical protein
VAFNCLWRSIAGGVQLPSAFKGSIACGVQLLRVQSPARSIVSRFALEFGFWDLVLGI